MIYVFTEPFSDKLTKKPTMNTANGTVYKTLQQKVKFAWLFRSALIRWFGIL